MTWRSSTVARLAVVVSIATSAGCFSSWVASQATGTQRVWDEQVREQVVPLPGVEDWLALMVVLPTPPASRAVGSTAGTYTTPADPAATRPRLQCTVAQRAREAVYHAAFRYGSRWTKGTAVMFVLEGAAAALYLLAGDRQSPDLLVGSVLALDAVGTAALFFAPRKEIYRRDEQPSTTKIRTDCPEGLELWVGEERFAIDAAGHLDELGEEAFARWRETPGAPLIAALRGRSVELRIGLHAGIGFPAGVLSTVVDGGATAD